MAYSERSRQLPFFTSAPRVLVVEARFHADVADFLYAGVRAVLDASGAQHDRVDVPGALEIPAAIAMANRSGKYDGYIALGCVIRGDTYHFEIVCNESSRGLTDLGVAHGLAIGNGILTCNTMEQALARARPDQQDKGGDAAYAALKLLALRGQFGLM